MILTFINNKGGVGKTTAAITIAAAFAARNLHTLLVDLDSQGSASISLGVEPENLSPSIADVLLDDTPARSVIRTTSIDGLDLITGEMDLAEADISLSAVAGREHRLRDALQPLRNDYHFIIIDCPPSLAIIPINALLACDAYIVPIVPQPLPLYGLLSLTNAITRLSQGTGIMPRLLGIAITIADTQTTTGKEANETLREHYKGIVFSTEIPKRTRIAQAPQHGVTILQHDTTPDGREGAAAYNALADEILSRCENI